MSHLTNGAVLEVSVGQFVGVKVECLDGQINPQQ